MQKSLKDIDQNFSLISIKIKRIRENNISILTWLLFFKSTTQAINLIPTDAQTFSTDSSNSPSTTDNTETNYDEEAKIIKNSDSAPSPVVSRPPEDKTGIDSSKNIPIIFFEKFNPQNLLRPVQQKWKEIQDLLMYPFHPNYGGLVLLSPQHIWSKLKEKGHFILGGAHNSIFGTAHPPPEYPFPYRQAGQG